MNNTELTSLRDAIDAHLNGRAVEYSANAGTTWESATNPTFSSLFLWRQKPEPKIRRWNSPADVPGPICWIRPNNADTATLIVGLSKSGFVAFKSSNEAVHLLWVNAIDYQHSIDRVNWKKCEVPE